MWSLFLFPHVGFELRRKDYDCVRTKGSQFAQTICLHDSNRTLAISGRELAHRANCWEVFSGTTLGWRFVFELNFGVLQIVPS